MSTLPAPCHPDKSQKLLSRGGGNEAGDVSVNGGLEGDGETAANAGAAFNLDGPLVRFNDATGNGETESGAAGLGV